MKKCPYCAEKIQDEAIVCRYCGRDLVPNVEQTIDSRKNTETKISLDEIYDIANVFAQSYQFMSLVPTTNKIVQELAAQIVTPIFDKYLEHKLATEESVKQELTNILGRLYLWSFVCLGIGFEHGLGGLEFKQALRLVFVISDPMSEHVAGYYGGLLIKGLLGREELQAQYLFIAEQTLQAAQKIAGIGIGESNTLNRKNLNFLQAINQLPHE